MEQSVWDYLRFNHDRLEGHKRDHVFAQAIGSRHDNAAFLQVLRDNGYGYRLMEDDVSYEFTPPPTDGRPIDHRYHYESYNDEGGLSALAAEIEDDCRVAHPGDEVSPVPSGDFPAMGRNPTTASAITIFSEGIQTQMNNDQRDNAINSGEIR